MPANTVVASSTVLAMTGYETALVVVAASFIGFALIVALVVPRSRPSFPGNRLGVFLAVCGVFFLAQLTTVLVLAEVGEADEPAQEETAGGGETTTGETTTGETATEETTTGAQPTQGDPVAGKAVFLGSSGCAGCHTLSDAGSTGTIGPNLDAVRPTYDKAVAQVTTGGGGMPAFGDSLSEEQIRDVAAYVSSAAQG